MNKTAFMEKINIGEDEEMIIEGYKRSYTKTILFWIAVILSFGVILLISSWKPSFFIKFTYFSCTLDQADKVLLTDKYGQQFIETIIKPDYQLKTRVHHIYFIHKMIKYIWKDELRHFTRLTGLEQEKCGTIYAMSDGLSNSEANIRLQMFGLNAMKIKIKSIPKIILDQQMLSLKEKLDTSSLVIVIRDAILTTKKSTELVPGDVIIIPNNCQYLLEFDAVLISGSCTVDESILTGESVPISKISLNENPDILYSPSTHSKNTLFCGTTVIKVQNANKVHVKALVVRTGFYTGKGKLVRNILFPKPYDQKFRKDLIKCLVLFFIMGIPSMIYTGYIFNKLETSYSDTIIIVIDIATFLVPPLLPAVLTSTNAYAQRRLRTKGIYCLDSNYINPSANIDFICFDKTGTLTENNIDVAGVVPVNEHGEFLKPVRNIKELNSDTPIIIVIGNCHSLVFLDDILKGDMQELKLFNSLDWIFKENVYINDTNAFESLPDRITGPKDADISYGLIRLFPFESSLQRMTVVIRKSYSNYFVVMKGAPEKVKNFCKEASLPNDFDDVLNSYTRDGMRVIAGALKILDNYSLDDVMKSDRKQLEDDMIFSGLIVFQNKLKSETIPTLKILKDVEINTVMVTGDNILTALSVARNCGMIEENDSVVQVNANIQPDSKTIKHKHISSPKIFTNFYYVKLPGFSEKINLNERNHLNDLMVPIFKKEVINHLSIEGPTFDLICKYDRLLLNKIILSIKIFARMSPDNKLQLVHELQKLEKQVMMVGDGANDCGALRQSDCGISLSLAESSVACSFTYPNKNISCVPLLMQEGRNVFASTIGVLKYQVSYCFILLAAVLILFLEGQKTSDGGFVFIDIILNILPPIVFGTTKPYPKLTKIKPMTTLFAFLPLFSIFSFVSIQIFFYLMSRELLIQQEWYEPFHFNATIVNQPEPSHMALTILSVNTMSYVISSIIFAPGPPYRMNFFSNKKYMTVVIINFTLAFIVTVYPAPKFILNFVNFKDVPKFEFKLVLFGVSFVNFVICYIWENGFIGNVLTKLPLKFRRKSNKHIDNLSEWLRPQISKKSSTSSSDDDQEINWIHLNRIEEIDLQPKRTIATFISKKCSN